MDPVGPESKLVVSPIALNLVLATVDTMTLVMRDGMVAKQLDV